MAVAIREELRRRKPATECLFVGTEKGLESRILPPLDFPLRTIRISGVKNMGFSAALKGWVQIPGSLFQSWRIVSRFNPSVAVGLGGYSSGPVVVASRLRRVPAVVIEPNVVPGMANRLLARWIDGAAFAFPETAAHFKQNGRLTGIPIRTEFHRIAAADKRNGALRILIFGGSRGSRPINDLVCEALDHLPGRRFRIRHQTGPSDFSRVRDLYRQKGVEAEVTEYIDEMPRCFADSDLIVSRSGASSIAEITAAGRPSILIPFPHAADDHQRKNAESLMNRGAAMVLEQKGANGKALARMILDLDGDRNRLAGMAAAAKGLAQPDSASRIVDLLEEVAGNRK